MRSLRVLANVSVLDAGNPFHVADALGSLQGASLEFFMRMMHGGSSNARWAARNPRDVWPKAAVAT